MCELLTISSQFPAHMGFSLSRLASHSQSTENDIFSNPDGWGVAFYEGNDVTLLREPQSAHNSELVQFIEQHIPATHLLISHIRKATQGNNSLSNTQPFSRELAGRMHVFAHNGNFPDITDDPLFSLRHYHAVGETDSEHAFCYLLDKLRPIWLNRKDQSKPPSIHQRFDIISSFAEKMRQFGPANFVYSDADACFAHAHKRIQKDGMIKPPGLYLLQRCYKHETHGLNLKEQKSKKHKTSQQKVIIVASVPLTNEKWQIIDEGKVIAFNKGRIFEL